MVNLRGVVKFESGNKYAWTWRVKEECLKEYVKMHLEPWPEVMKEHSKAGIKNYSIFQNGNQFFYCFECDDVEKAFKYIGDSDICREWSAITSKMVKGSFNFEETNTIKFMKEVFYLK
ncbi:MAG: L-rhamnose mutarotase [Clostridiales bacterium]|nr:L-rhamnose mutarotase [Clostridiales bacterium]